MVMCTNCKRLFHERCVFHLDVATLFGAPFYCKNCGNPNDFRFVPFKARDIPRTDCDRFITAFVRDNMDESFNSPITIRMLSNMKTSFSTNYKLNLENGFSQNIGYTNCTIFAFLEDCDKVDICFFTIFVQLYGKDAPKPNQKSAYISYIDSVKIYHGKNRSKLYQLVILGLFKYLKLRGFEKIFIWSCPPEKDVDYVFPFKPKAQKIPDENILNDWYMTMIDCGKEKDIIQECEHVESFSQEANWKHIKNIPMFHDDLWVGKVLEVISKVEKEVYNLQASNKPRGYSLHVDKSARFWELLQTHAKRFDHCYFILKLKSKKSSWADFKPDLTEINREWMNNRHLLVDFFCEWKLMFSDIRQARFATYVLVHRIHLETGRCRLCLKQSPRHNLNVVSMGN